MVEAGLPCKDIMYMSIYIHSYKNKLTVGMLEACRPCLKPPRDSVFQFNKEWSQKTTRMY